MKEVVQSAVIKSAKVNQSPETIVVKILGTSGIDLESKTKLLQEVAQGVGDDVLARGIFEWAYATSLVEGIPVSNSFERLWGGLSVGAKELLFKQNPGVIGRVERFANTLDTVSLARGLTKPPSVMNPTLMALGQSTAIVGGLGDMVFQFSGTGLILGGTTVATALFGPALLAKLITRPQGAELAALALKTPATSRAGQRLLRIFSTFFDTAGDLTRETKLRAPSLVGRALSSPDEVMAPLPPPSSSIGPLRNVPSP